MSQRIQPLLDKVAEINPAAFPFLERLVQCAAIVDDVVDGDNFDGRLLGSVIYNLLHSSHSDPWAAPRMSALLPMIAVAQIYWHATHEMPRGTVRGVLKDKFNDIFIYALAEKLSAEELTAVILNIKFETE